MAFTFTLLFLLMFSFSFGDEDSQNICISDNYITNSCKCVTLGDSHLKLEDLSSVPEHSKLEDLPQQESKLICRGINALESATEIISTQKYLLFVDIIISNTSLQSIHHNYFQHFSYVKNLSLANNAITSIESKAFKDQKILEVLNLSFNNIQILQNDVFEDLESLKNLSLAYNKINSIESKVFNSLQNLLYLDLSNNNLTSLDSNWFVRLKNLQRLDLSFNSLKIVPNGAFHRLKNLKFLSLAMNELETLNESVFKGNNILEKVNLTGNLWVCDRKLLPLNDWLKKYEAYKEGAFCIEPPDFHNYTVQHGLDILYLEMKIEESPICNQTMCNCTISKDKLVVTVDCSSRGFVRLPEVVPYKTKVLNLYNNNIKSLTTDHIDATLWSDVSFLYLNNNVIDSLKGLEGTWLLRNLVALHLSSNHLTEIPIHILEQFRGGLLDELFLSGNPWKCDCNTVRFQTWLQDNYRAVRNFEGICCSSDSGIYSNLPIDRLKKSQLCPQQVQLVNYLDILNGLMAVTIILIIIKLSYDYWLQKRTGKLPRFFSLNLM